MRLLLAILFFIMVSPALAQDEVILLRGRITDKASNPIPDAHIINYRNLNIVLSNEDGSFRMFAHTGDSLMVTLIAYEKKKVYARDIHTTPEIQLILDTINIALIEYHQNKKDDIEIAEENVKSILVMKFPPYVKIKTEMEPVYQMVLENNRLMRTEAASVTC